MNIKGLNKIIKTLEAQGVAYELTSLEFEYKGETTGGKAVIINGHYFVAHRGMITVLQENNPYYKYTLKNQNMALCYIFGYNNVLPNNYITIELDDETGAILGFSKNETTEETTEETEAELEAIAEKFAPKFISELTPEELEQLVEKAGNSILDMEKEALKIYENIKANSAESLPLEIWEKVYNFTSKCYDVWHDSLDVISDEKKVSKQFKVLKEELLSYAKKPEQPTEEKTEEKTVDNSDQVVYNEIKENNKEEKVESIMLNNQVEKNIQVEIIDYTRDYVYYYEDIIDAQNKLEHLYKKFPNNEIGVSYFTVYGVDIEWNEENIDFVEKSSPLELEAVVKILEYGYTSNKSLVDVALYMENSMCYHLISSEENKLNAFIELVDELGGVEFVENKEYYVDLEYLKRDYELSGDEIVQDMSQDEFEEFVYDCDLLNNDTIETYFDYEKYMRDFELSGSSIIELENKNFLFIF